MKLNTQKDFFDKKIDMNSRIPGIADLYINICTTALVKINTIEQSIKNINKKSEELKKLDTLKIIDMKETTSIQSEQNSKLTEIKKSKKEIEDIKIEFEKIKNYVLTEIKIKQQINDDNLAVIAQAGIEASKKKGVKKQSDKVKKGGNITRKYKLVKLEI